MDSIWVQALISVGAISLLSFVGAILFRVEGTKLKTVIAICVSLSAGAMMGNAFLHILPEAIEHAAQVSHQKMSPFKMVPATESDHAHTLGHDHDHDQEHDHDHDHDHDQAPKPVEAHGHNHGSGHGAMSVMALTGAGILVFFLLDFFFHWYSRTSHSEVKPIGPLLMVGDALENFTDGIVIAAAYMISPAAGLAATVAVAIHEIPLEVSDFGVLLHSGFKKSKALLFNFLSGLAALSGAVLVLWLGTIVENFAVIIAPVAAGAFIYMAISTLLPQVRTNAVAGTNGGSWHFLGVAAGLAFMYLIVLFE